MTVARSASTDAALEQRIKELQATIEELDSRNQKLTSQIGRYEGQMALLEHISEFRAGLAAATGVLERKARLTRIAEEIKGFFGTGGVSIHVKKTKDGTHVRHGEYDRDGLVSHPYIMIPDSQDPLLPLSNPPLNTSHVAAYLTEPSQLYLDPEIISWWLPKIMDPNKSKDYKEFRQRVEGRYEADMEKNPHLKEVYKTVESWYAKVHFPLKITRADGKIDVLAVLICDGFSSMPVHGEQIEFMQKRCNNEIAPMLHEIIEMERNQELTLGQVVFEAILQDPRILKGKRRNITALFGDLQGYTAQTDTLPAEYALERLRKFYDTVMPVILRHSEGLRPKLIGDGFLTFFNGIESRPQDDHALRAVRCASEIMSEVDKLNRSIGGTEYVVNFGIYTGPAAVGNIAGERDLALDFTSIGSTVNRASRIQGRARNGAIYVAQATIDGLASVPELSVLFHKGFEQGTARILDDLKGIEEQIIVYPVSPRK